MADRERARRWPQAAVITLFPTLTRESGIHAQGGMRWVNVIQGGASGANGRAGTEVLGIGHGV
jgi:hypothetical protein